MNLQSMLRFAIFSLAQLSIAQVMAAYGQTQYSPAIQPAGPYTPYTHHTQGYSVQPYSECSIYAWC